MSKHFNISFTFEPQHETELGFERSEFLSENFPYGRPQTTGLRSNNVTSANADVSALRANSITGGEE